MGLGHDEIAAYLSTLGATAKEIKDCAQQPKALQALAHKYGGDLTHVAQAPRIMGLGYYEIVAYLSTLGATAEEIKDCAQQSKALQTLAHKYGADLTTMVDRRVTGRHLVLAGRGGGADAPPPPPPPGRLPTFRGPHVAAP